MNINHAVEEKVEGDMLKAIFDRQKELMGKYHHIEERSGLCQTSDVPVNLDDKRGQARIKDFSWRVTEELGEALDARSSDDHYQEELIDGLHFLTELTILAGMEHHSILELTGGTTDNLVNLFNYSNVSIQMESEPTLEHRVTIFIMELAMMCNCLKNKPWKQSHMVTDKNAFYQRLTNSWINYIAILNISGLTPEDVTNIYLKKSQVNLFRQRSNY